MNLYCMMILIQFKYVQFFLLRHDGLVLDDALRLRGGMLVDPIRAMWPLKASDALLVHFDATMMSTSAHGKEGRRTYL